MVRLKSRQVLDSVGSVVEPDKLVAQLAPSEAASDEDEVGVRHEHQEVLWSRNIIHCLVIQRLDQKLEHFLKRLEAVACRDVFLLTVHFKPVIFSGC